MRNNKLKPPSFPLEFYPDELLVIKNIKFTPRHIDIMACLISGGTGKTISSLLSIEIKTIEAHKKDIAGRLGGGIQENIIAFIQSSDKYGLIKQHYLRLLKKVEFEKLLKELTKGIKKNLPHCIIEPKTAYQTQGKNKSTFINLLTYHLNLAGIKILEKSDQPGQYLDNKNTGAQLLYFIDEHLIDRLKSAPMSQKIILILQNPTLKEEFLKISHHINSIDFTDPSSYFRSFIELLERVTPSHDFTSLKAIMDGKELNSKNFNQNTAFKDLRADIGGIPFSLLPNILYSKKHKAIGIAFLIMSLLSLGFWIHTETGVETNNKISLASIHSDLVIPSEASLLNRQDLMAEIASQLKGDQGIQTVALVGMGGAGKTTLSRVYARKQQFPVVWEINAETRESLINSFKDLAYALAQSKEQKEELKFIQNIQNLGEKEKQFIFFVKRHLKNKGNWLLIYDNVETFSKIKDYFPQDPQIWGSGRVIITTRDNNIVNTNYIKAENVIHIEELSQSQTLTLFSKILYNCEPSQLLKEQKEKALNLLHHIPPFPLDISAAAYYIKNTKITYKEYLRRINSYSETFENFQETLIKESSNYTKTRYGIIISSLEKIIDIRPEYKELLLYICLLDSQNIPKELLEACKENTVIEQFIYNLKKYSLISKLNLKSNFSTYFSVHRSTQAIILIYLKSNLKLEEYKKFLTNISISFMNYLDSIISNEDFVKMPLLIAHSEKFLSHDRLLDDDTSILISGKLGDIYCYLANYQKARELLESTYHRSKSKNSPSIGLVLLNLGDVYREQGNYEKSIKVLNETLLIFKHNFHKFYNEYALTLGSLGYAYGSAGDYEMAKISLEKSLLIYKSNFNENSLRVAWMLARLGNIYKELGDYNKSIITLEQSFSIYKKYFILDHVRIAWIQAYLGDAYRMQGNYNKAKILLEQSFLTSKKHLTEAHVKTAWISIYLGNVYKELKDYKKAKELLLKGLVIYKQHYTKDHFEIAELLKDIGNIYLLDNKLLIAEDYYNRSVSIFKKNNHPKLYLVYEKLAYLYMQKSHQAKVRGHIQEFQIFEKKTLRYLQNALNIVTANFPENSPHKVKIQEKLKSIDAKFT